MRFSSMGSIENVPISATRSNEEHLASYKENISLQEKAIIDAEEKIADLENDLNLATSKTEKEQLTKELVLAKIDLVEAQIAKEFLEEESPQSPTKDMMGGSAKEFSIAS